LAVLKDKLQRGKGSPVCTRGLNDACDSKRESNPLND
jgi:hypothetical protein